MVSRPYFDGVEDAWSAWGPLSRREVMSIIRGSQNGCLDILTPHTRCPIRGCEEAFEKVLMRVTLHRVNGTIMPTSTFTKDLRGD